LKNKLQSYGLKVISTNTDCLNVVNEPEKLNTFINDNKPLFSYSHKNNHDAIGKLKMEKKTVTLMSSIKKKSNFNVFFTIKEQNKTFMNNIELNDEFD